jgi:hypothetical protein
MKCPKCGFENPKDTEICQSCKSIRFVKAGGGQFITAPVRSGPVAQAFAGAPPPAPVSTGLPVGKRHLLERVGAPPIELTPGALFTFGRAPTCTLPIPSTRVSRVHAEIRWENEQPILCDKGSANGTSIGGKRLTKEHPLKEGDEIEVGPFLCVYHHEGNPKKDSPLTQHLDPPTITAAGDALAGQINDSGLTEVLQGIEFNAKSGTLSVFSRDGGGSITFLNGVPHQAESGDLKDEEAVFALLKLKKGRFSFSPEIEEAHKTRRMKNAVTALLLELGRRLDEAAGQETVDGS